MSSTSPLKDSWNTAASGLWSIERNWTLGRAPRGVDLVEIEASSPISVTFDASSLKIGGLRLTGVTLSLQDGFLKVAGPASLTQACLAGSKPLVLSGETTLDGLTLGDSASLLNYGALVQRKDVMLASSSVVRNLAGADWKIADASGLQIGENPGARFVNAGVFEQTSTSATAHIAVTFIWTGEVSAASGGGIDFAGPVAKLSGNLRGGGEIGIGAQGVGALGGLDLTDGTDLTNHGRASIFGDLTFHEGSTFLNDAKATMNFANDSSLRLASGESGALLLSRGTILKSGGDSFEGSEIETDVDVWGPIKILAGALSFRGSRSFFRGLVSGSGWFNITGGDVEFGPRARVATENWSMWNENVFFGGSMSYAGHFAWGGSTLALNGSTLTLTGVSTLVGTAITTSGQVVISGQAEAGGFSVAAGVELIDRGAVTQIGDLKLDGDAVKGATLSIQNGAVWDVGYLCSVRSGAGASSSVRIGESGSNGGLLVFGKHGASSSTVETSIVNNGVNDEKDDGVTFRGVELWGQSRRLTVKGAITGVGSLNIVGGDLRLSGAVGEGQTVSFWDGGGAGSLRILDPLNFHANIADRHAGGSNDRLQIAGTWTLTGAVIQSDYSTLVFRSNGDEFDLRLMGHYDHGFAYARGSDLLGSYTEVIGWKLH